MSPGDGLSREHYWVLVIALALPVVGLGLGLWLQPDPRGFGTHEQLGFQPCASMRTWNVPCPGCGVTTAVALAARGRVLASLGTQPFGLVALVASLVFASWALGCHLRRRDLLVELRSFAWKRWGLVLGALGLASWAFKAARVRGWA